MIAEFWMLALLVYLLPAAIIVCRKAVPARHKWAVFTLNLALGWTFVGYAGALAWAAFAPEERA
jgi:hypothetical protein